jgi:TetR/AcrR family transcriptional regulator, fatty acid biosynthesis regulator
MLSTALRKRTRLEPEVRRGQILDAASRLVVEEGLAALTMERLGRDVGISKALVYNYYASRETLLEALLQREQDDLRDRGMAAALRAESFEDLIRQTTRLYLEQVRDRGALIATITADPTLAQSVEAVSRVERDRTISYFARMTSRAYDLAPNVAATCVDMLMTVTGSAGRLVAEDRIEVAAATDLCVTLIIGALERASGKVASPLH